MDALAQNAPLVIAAIVVLVLLVAGAVGVGFSSHKPEARSIRVVGVGGGGSNAIDEMIRSKTAGVDFIACNTDAQALRRSAAPRRLRIGDKITHGLGAGGDPEVGRQAAEEDAETIGWVLEGSDMVFVTAGLGGGTGSGAAPIVAEIAKKHGALTIGVVTKPFAFEGARRRRVAEDAARELAAKVDALITIPNDRVSEVVQRDARFLDAFRTVDDVLRQGVQGIIDVVATPGLINLDFADVRAIMQDAGPALIGFGRAGGEQRALLAAQQAMSSPLLEASFGGARGILFNLVGSSDVRLAEVTEAAEAIRSAADPEANVIFGASFDDRLGDEVSVTLIAVGLGEMPANKPAHAEMRTAAEAVAASSAPPLDVGGTELETPKPVPSNADAAELDVPTFLRRSRAPVRRSIGAVRRSTKPRGV